MRVTRLQCVGVKSTKIVLLTRGVYELIDLLWLYIIIIWVGTLVTDSQ